MSSLLVIFGFFFWLPRKIVGLCHRIKGKKNDLIRGEKKNKKTKMIITASLRPTYSTIVY